MCPKGRLRTEAAGTGRVQDMDLGGAVVVYVMKIHRIFGHDKLSEARIDADGLPLFVGPVVGRVARDQHAHAARLQHGAGPISPATSSQMPPL